MKIEYTELIKKPSLCKAFQLTEDFWFELRDYISNKENGYPECLSIGNVQIVPISKDYEMIDADYFEISTQAGTFDVPIGHWVVMDDREQVNVVANYDISYVKNNGYISNGAVLDHRYRQEAQE